MRSVMLAASVLNVLSVTSMVHAAFMASADFQLGYGATGANPVWTAAENAGTNSPATQGDFTFRSVPPTGGEAYSGTGPTFTGMTLNTSSSSDYAAFYGIDSGTPYGLSLSITGSYNGTAPSNASSTPDYRLTLEVANISVYGIAATGTEQNWYWQETTPGHLRTSAVVTVGSTSNGADFALASKYTKVAWNPDDDAVSLTGLNDQLTRTFTLLPVNGCYASIDGIELQGRVLLTYNLVPEPSTVILLASALLGLLCYAWRKQK